MGESCVIIGGGIGGLFTGAFLSKNGIKVTVLEKNGTIGGGLQCFKRGGKTFETGMHLVGGMIEGNLKKICDYLEINHLLKIHHLSEENRDEVWINKTRDKYILPSGKERFIEKLSNYFPAEKSGIKKYVKALYSLVEEVPLFNLKEETCRKHSEQFFWPVDRFIEHYIMDEKLRYLLAYLNPLYAGIKKHTPAYIHALINVLYINGTSRFIGGGQQLADALKGVIEENGGTVHIYREVTKINTDGKSITGVETKFGYTFSGDYYVAAIHPHELLHLLPSGSLGKIYEKRLMEIPSTLSAFSLYIKFKPDTFEKIDQTCFYLEDYKDIWERSKDTKKDWPHNFLYMTSPVTENKKFAETMVVLCLMDWEEVKNWENSIVGQREDSYYKWKQQCVKKILKKLDRCYPEIKKKIKATYSASPLTIRDYYYTKEGSLYGYSKDVDDLYLSQLSVNTRLSNFFLTGQNVILHGICGVPLTAIITAEAILGEGKILKQINNA